MNDKIWIDLGPERNFPATGHTCLNAVETDGTQGRSLIVLNVEDQWYALENRCPHAGRPLGDGECAEMTITCPYHGYTYHIKTGKNIDFPDEEAPVKTFPVRVENGNLQIQLTNGEADTP